MWKLKKTSRMKLSSHRRAFRQLEFRGSSLQNAATISFLNSEEAFSSRNTQKKNFLNPQRESNPWPCDKCPFIHICHFDTLSLAVWQVTCHTYKNLVVGPCSPRISHSSVVRASNRYLEGHGFESRWGVKKFFFWVFRLENASSLFTLYPSHQSIYH